VFVTAVVCAAAVITTIPFNGILPSTAVAQQQRINSNISSSQKKVSTGKGQLLPYQYPLDSSSCDRKNMIHPA